MSEKRPVLVIMHRTIVRRPGRRPVVLTPGYKDQAATERIKSALSTHDKLNELKARGRVVEEEHPPF